MEFMLRLAKCTTVHFKYIIKIEVIIFHSFTKNKETKRMPMQISKKKNQRAVVSLLKICRSKILVIQQKFITTFEIHYKKDGFL